MLILHFGTVHWIPQTVDNLKPFFGFTIYQFIICYKKKLKILSFNVKENRSKSYLVLVMSYLGIMYSSG